MGTNFKSTSIPIGGELIYAFIDQTHESRLESWVPFANGHSDFQIQNLPFGMFRHEGGAAKGGVAIGQFIFDLRAAASEGLLNEVKKATQIVSTPPLNAFLALGAGPFKVLRARLSAILARTALATPAV